jgi:WD40 repeat protein
MFRKLPSFQTPQDLVGNVVPSTSCELLPIDYNSAPVTTRESGGKEDGEREEIPMVDRVKRFLFGDDIFISYSRADGASYAAALANQLSGKRLYCRFDQWGTVPGQEVPEDILKALRRSGALIIVATEKAYESTSVEREIREFLQTKRLIVPIDLCGRIFSAMWWPLLAGLPVSKDHESDGHSRITAIDGQIAPGTAGPLTEVVSRIENSIDFTKKDTRLRQAAVVALALLVTFMIGAAVAAKIATTKSLEAAGESRLANEAIDNRKAAERSAKKADDRRKEAETQTTVALQELSVAGDRTKKAVEERLHAESLKKRADLLTKARITLDSRDPLAALEHVGESLKLADGSDARLLLAEAYNDGVPHHFLRMFTQIRQFHLCPSDSNRLVAIGFTDEQQPPHNQIAYLDLSTNTTRVSQEFEFLSAIFSPDGNHIYAVAVTKDERGPEKGMDTKIVREVSLLKYNLSLHVEQRLLLDTIKARRELATIEQPINWDIRDIQDLRVSRSGDRLVMAGYASQAYMANVSNAAPFHLRSWIMLSKGTVVHSLDTEHELSSFSEYRGRVVFLNDSQIVVDGVREVYEVDMNTGARVLLGRHTGSVGDLAANASGETVTAIGGDNRVTIFRKEANEWKATVETLQGDDSCDRVAFFDDDKIAVARGNGNVSLLWIGKSFDDESLHLDFDLAWRTGREKTLVGHTARISVIAVSPNGRWIATGSEDKTVRLWSPYEYASRVLYGSKRGVTDVQFSRDSKTVYVSDSDGLLQTFAVEDEKLFALPVEPGSKRHEEQVPDASWDEGGGLTMYAVREHLGFVRDLVERSDGHLVAHTYDRRRTEWDEGYHLLNTIEVPPETLAESENRSESQISASVLEEVAGSDRHDGRRLNPTNQWAETLDNKSLRLYSLPFPAERKDKKREKDSEGIFSPDGRWFLQFDYKDQYLRIWKTNALEAPAASLEIVYGEFHRDHYGGPDSALHVRFSNAGEYLGFPILADGEAVCVIDLRTFRVRIFREDIVLGAFDVSDNGYLVAAGRTGEVYIHNISKDSTSILEKHGRYVSSVAITSDGHWVASGSRDRSVRLWSVESGQYCEFRLKNPVERVIFNSGGTELLAAAGRAIHGWYVPSGSDPFGEVQHSLNTVIRSYSTDRVDSARQADNLAIVVHTAVAEPRSRLIESSLSRRIQLTESYKRQLLDLLSSANQPQHTRVRAALELSCFGSSALQDVSEISKQLRSDVPADDPIVQAVVSLLRSIGPAVEDDLRTELAHASDPSLSNGLVYALAVLFGESASTRKDLHDHLTDENEITRITVALLLNANGKDAESVPVLAEAIASGNEKREEAAKAISQYGSDAVSDLIRVLGSREGYSYRDSNELVRKALVAVGRPAVPALLVALKTTQGDQQKEVVTALGEIGPPASEAVETLIDLDANGTTRNRSEILNALASIGPSDGRVIDFLISVLLTSTDPLGASFALERTSASDAVPRLRKVLREQPSSPSTKYAVMALGSFGAGAGEAVPDLMTILASSSSHNLGDVGNDVVEALGKIGPSAREASSLLLTRLERSSGYEKSQVLEALGKVLPAADKTIPAILAAVRQEMLVEDFRRFRITRQALEDMARRAVPEDVVRSLEPLDDAIGRQEGLFSNLVMRDIGSSNWNAFRNQILDSALESAPHECDEYGVFRSAFDAVGGFHERARSFAGEIKELRQSFKDCRDVSGHIDAILANLP